MRYSLLILIRLYWLVPGKYKPKCIFKESCSRYVYRITKTKGFKAGVLAIRERKQKCKKGYYYITSKTVRLADYSVISNSSLNEEIL